MTTLLDTINKKINDGIITPTYNPSQNMSMVNNNIKTSLFPHPLPVANSSIQPTPSPVVTKNVPVVNKVQNTQVVPPVILPTNVQTTIPTAPVTTPPPTSAAGMLSGFNLTPEQIQEQNDRNAIANGYRADATQNIDPNQIYQDKLSKYQAEIDAINNVYNDKLNVARTQGIGRLGSNRAIQARSGLLASDFGATQTDNVNTANADVLSGINNERAVAIQAILGKARAGAEEEARLKTEAKKAGADALIKYYDESNSRKKTRVSDAVKQFLLNNGVDNTNIPEDQMKQISDSLGITKDELSAEIKSQATTIKAAQDKAAQDKAKTEADIAKTVKETSLLGKITPYQQAQLQIEREKLDKTSNNAISNLSQLFTQGAIVPNSSGVPFIDSSGYATPEGFKTAIKAAIEDKISRIDFIKQFGNYIPAGYESAYGITPAEIKIITGELPAKE